MLPAGPKGRDAQYATLPTGLSGAEWSRAVHLDPPYEWQAPLVDALTALDRPRVAYVQVARKNGKSRLAADIALHDMCQGKQVFLLSDSERNLKSALFHELTTLVRRSPTLSAAVLLYKDHLECPSSGGAISLRPNNLSASQSINPETVIVDEVHMQKTDSIWNGMLLAGAASRSSLLLGITTPGYQTVSLAHDLYEAVKAGKMWGRIFEAPEKCSLDDEAALHASNPVLLERPDMREVFAFERKNMSEHDYRRFRLGQWTETASAWLRHGLWASRTAPAEYVAGEKLWVGFDGSYSGDSTALVACNAAGHVKILGCWEAPRAREKGWRVPRDQVKAAVTDVMDNYDAMLYPDPPYWQSEIAEWDALWPNRVIEFPTGSPARMGPAVAEFHAVLSEGRLTHDGDRRLEAHLSHCVSKPTSHGELITKSSPDSPHKIDLAVAAVIAVSHAQIASAVPVRPIFVM